MGDRIRMRTGTFLFTIEDIHGIVKLVETFPKNCGRISLIFLEKYGNCEGTEQLQNMDMGTGQFGVCATRKL